MAVEDGKHPMKTRMAGVAIGLQVPPARTNKRREESDRAVRFGADAAALPIICSCSCSCSCSCPLGSARPWEFDKCRMARPINCLADTPYLAPPSDGPTFKFDILCISFPMHGIIVEWMVSYVCVAKGGILRPTETDLAIKSQSKQGASLSTVP